MAVQNGVHTFIGKLGTTRGFKMKQLAPTFEGLLGGADRNTILTAPEFVRTRENMSEFAGCAKMGKRIRDSSTPIPQQISDVIVTGRMVAILERLIKLDTISPRGQRTLNIFANPTFLVGFEFNRFRPFGSYASMPYTATQTPSQSLVNIPSFLPTDYLQIPSGATHFSFIFASMTISNYIYDPNGYIPSQVTGNGSVSLIVESPLSLTVATAPIVNAQIQPISANGTDQASLGILGIVFWQQIGVDFYRLQQNSAAFIVGGDS